MTVPHLKSILPFIDTKIPFYEPEPLYDPNMVLPIDGVRQRTRKVYAQAKETENPLDLFPKKNHTASFISKEINVSDTISCHVARKSVKPHLGQKT